MTARTTDGRLVCARCQRGFNMLRSWGLCEACSAAEPEPASEWRDRELARLRADLDAAHAVGRGVCAELLAERAAIARACATLEVPDLDTLTSEALAAYDAIEAAQRRGSALAEDVRAAIEWCDGVGAPDVRAALARYDAAEGSEDA